MTARFRVPPALDDPGCRAALLGLILVFAFAIRAYLVITTVPIYDEYHWIRRADRVNLTVAGFDHAFERIRGAPGQILWTGLGGWMLGPNLVGYRLTSFLLGTSAVLAMYFVGKRLAGPHAGLIAAFLLAVNEYHVGISRVCTEKSYLALALWGLVLVERALEKRSTGRLVALGIVLGLGLMTKLSLVLWLPVLGYALITRGSGPAPWRRPAIWVGMLVILLLLLPELYVNTAVVHRGKSPMEFFLGRLSIGGVSWGPLALFIRPLDFNLLSRDLHEYPTMTTLPGMILLAGSLASVWMFRTPQARQLQVLGAVPFVFFTLFTIPRAEVWWSDLATIPAIALTGAVLSRVTGIWNVAVVAVGIVMLHAAWNVVNARDNYFAPDLAPPPPEIVEVHRLAQRTFILGWREFDILQLCTFAGRRLPVCRNFEDSLAWYQGFLTGLDRGDPEAERWHRLGEWPPLTPRHRQVERARAAAELERFRGPGVGSDSVTR